MRTRFGKLRASPYLQDAYVVEVSGSPGPGSNTEPRGGDCRGNGRNGGIAAECDISETGIVWLVSFSLEGATVYGKGKVCLMDVVRLTHACHT